jgi:tripartite ATP-independent transporter DctP family solute receptor
VPFGTGARRRVVTIKRGGVMKLRIFVAAAAAAFLTGKALAQTELKLGHVGEPGSLIGAAADEFAKRANERLKGKYKVVTYGSSQLGGDKELLQKLKLGTVDFAEPSTVMSSEADIFGVFEMPYLVKDREHMKRIEKELFWSKMEPAVEKKGLKILAVWENGFRHITNNKHPIVTPKDLEGIKLRVPEGKWRVKMFQAYGANPSPMKFSEVFTALQTGVMDGQENPFAQIYSAKFYEVQKYLSLTGHVYSPAYLAVGLKKWNKLPADVRKTLESTAKEVQAWVYEKAAKDDEVLLEKMKAAGTMKVNEANKDAFIAASKPVYAEFAKEVPGAQQIIDRAIALGKK